MENLIRFQDDIEVGKYELFAHSKNAKKAIQAATKEDMIEFRKLKSANGKDDK